MPEQDRLEHQQGIRSFLQSHFGGADWRLALPQGSGHETYFAYSGGRAYFIKLGAQLPRYQAMAAAGLTPCVLAAGCLPDGEVVIVQPYITGRTPSRKDYRDYLEQFATVIRKTHHNRDVQRALPKACSDQYSLLGLEMLARLRQRWAMYRSQALQVAGFVDESLDALGEQIGRFAGGGVVASHNDICNANWLISADGQLYLIDLEAMTLDDPALDIGATLWWYYPPPLRQRFLEIAGYANDEAFQLRMSVRMAMHCLHIILPREQSFDRFAPDNFEAALADFKALVAGRENPQGYEDQPV